MKHSNLILTLAVAGTLALTYACNSSGSTAQAAEITQDSLVKRGDYLVTVMGCDHCHSAKIMGPQGPQLDMEHRFGGFLSTDVLGPIDTSALSKGWVLFHHSQTAVFGPWGVSFGANISSSDKGIGNWTEEQFNTAMRKGKYKGLEQSRPLMPPMPWDAYQHLKDEDMKAIFAYLKTTKPVDNVVPEWIPFAEIKPAK